MADVKTEFAALLDGIEQRRGVRPSMSDTELSLMAFDLEQRHRLAEVRAWVSQNRSDAPAAKSVEPVAVVDSDELTPTQRAMHEKMVRHSESTKKPRESK